MANNLDLNSTANEIEKNLPSREYTLGKGLLQPFNDTNSGSRKIMQGIQKEQSIQLCKAETPIIMTGYENKFAYLSSNYVKTDNQYKLIDKIYKYANKYYALLYDIEHKMLHCVERVTYEYRTEIYGININNDGLDRFNKGETIPKGTTLVKSDSFDEEDNKTDGINLTTVYMALGLTTEDPIVVSQSAANRFKAPLFNEIEIVINENDIPLNMYGDDTYYKAFPNIGEKIKDSIVCAIRRERKDDEALYSQSKERLKQLMISDTTYISDGEIVDIDVYCNNPDKLEDMYYQQLKEYYDKNIDFCIKLYKTVDKFLDSHPGVKMTYDMQSVYRKCKDTANGIPYIKDKVFNNIILRIITRENKVLRKGDKITDRYGGKGVISAILPDDQMPLYFRNGNWYSVDAIYNSSTIINRLNPGQSFETELTWIGSKLLEAIGTYWYPAKNEDMMNGMSYLNRSAVINDAEQTVLKYLSMINIDYATDFHRIIMSTPIEVRIEDMDYLIESGNIPVVITPMKNEMTLEILKNIYNTFPWIKEEYLYINQKDSNGNIRKIRTNRPLVVGKKYIYRLKQLAEEKFSAVSLASTNIRGENTKTKANKMHISPIAKTPVRIGGMEASELMQLPECQFTVEALMMLSTAPTARRMMKQLLIGDPFDRNIVLDENARSRNVEIANAYLKCLGLKLEFKKVPKKLRVPILRKAISRVKPDSYRQVITKLPVKVTGEGYNKARAMLVDMYDSSTDIKVLGNSEVSKEEKINNAINSLLKISNTDEQLIENVKLVKTFEKRRIPILRKVIESVMEKK